MRQDFVGLSYPDRRQLLATEGATLRVFVPVVEQPWLAAGSGIVGASERPLLASPGPRPFGLLCYYEGFVQSAYQHADLDARGRWEAAVRIAADRAFVEYPTIARRAIELHHLATVGTIHADGTLTITDEVLVQHYCNVTGGPGPR